MRSQGATAAFSLPGGEAGEGEIRIHKTEFSVGKALTAAFRADMFTKEECKALIDEAESHAAQRTGGWTRTRYALTIYLMPFIPRTSPNRFPRSTKQCPDSFPVPTGRHANFPTTDIPVEELPIAKRWFSEAIEERVFPFMAACYPELIPRKPLPFRQRRNHHSPFPLFWCTSHQHSIWFRSWKMRTVDASVAGTGNSGN